MKMAVHQCDRGSRAGVVCSGWYNKFKNKACWLGWHGNTHAHAARHASEVQKGCGVHFQAPSGQIWSVPS